MTENTSKHRVHVRPRGAVIVIFLTAVVILGACIMNGASDSGSSYQPAQGEPWLGWTVIGLSVLGLIAMLSIGLVLYALARLALSLQVAWHAHQYQRALDDLELQRTSDRLGTERDRAALDAARVQSWAEHGRLGALVRQIENGWQVINLDAERGAVLLGDNGDVDRLQEDPLSLAQIEAQFTLEVERARSSALSGMTTYSPRIQTTNGANTNAPQLPGVSWPSRVWLRDLVPQPASITSLVLGITVDPETGEQRPVTAALSSLVHFAVGGSSGWGKSVFLRALALQLASAAEPCRLVLIDLEGVTFSPFSTSERLLWPVVDTETVALTVMRRLVREMDRRKELYSSFAGVDSLKAYNDRAEDPLPPVVILIDEATALLDDRSIHNATRTLALRARKYGLWLVLGGQDWKAASIDTAIRNQLSTRVHFKAQSPSQSRVLLGDGCAAVIESPGRAWAQLPGRPLLQMQAPMVTLSDIDAALSGQVGPLDEWPEPECESCAAEPTEERIRELAEQGLSLSAIQRELFGYVGGAAYEAVRRALDTTTT